MASEGVTLPPVTATLALGDPHKVTLVSVARTLLRHYPGRTTLGLVLMASQAFIYNAIFFTYALVLTRFYGVRGRQGRPLHPALRHRQFPGAAAARPVVRLRSAARR